MIFGGVDSQRRPVSGSSGAPSSRTTASREALAVALFFGAVLTFFSLISYRPADVSLNTSGLDPALHNWMGLAGAYWADMLLQVFGGGAMAWVMVGFYGAYASLMGRVHKPSKRVWAGAVCVCLSLAVLTHLIFFRPSMPFPPSGVLGALLTQGSVALFARAGAYLMALAVLFIAVSLLSNGWMDPLRQAIEKRFPIPQTPIPVAAEPAPAPHVEPVPVKEEPWFHHPAVAQTPLLSAAQEKQEPAPAFEEPIPAIVDVRPEVPLELLEDVGEVEEEAFEWEEDTEEEAEELEEEDTEEAEEEPIEYQLPAVSMLDFEAAVRIPVDPAVLRENASKLTQTLRDYGIDGHVREIRPGPVVTMYEYVPGPGIKLSKIASLADDLAMSMEALRVRIVAPIPGKGAVGIEIPNEVRETVFLKEIVAHDSFKNASSCLSMALGKDIEGAAYVADLAKMPHLLVAGATGAGKSVSINAMIMSVLFKATPEQVRMIMVDPKMLELSVYEGIPHLLLPVVTDPKKAAMALRWTVEEMERRYEWMSSLGVRNIDGYNAKVLQAEQDGEVLMRPSDDGETEVECEKLPYILVVVDELADLMMVATKEVESSIMRLAQMARASGIHLILATQRPSVDVLTGVIKANFPTRIAFQVASRHDSRTIIDANGAEHLLGRGDMLYLSPGAGGLLRVHGAYVSDRDIERTVAFWREQGEPDYKEDILTPRENAEELPEEEEEHDELYQQAVAVVMESKQASVSLIQRRLRIGYNRAARMVDRMEREGLVGPADGAKPREVLVASAS
jgi:S-DNA-T family DNA segregation ATPase FtsK/SpoIIIE